MGVWANRAARSCAERFQNTCQGRKDRIPCWARSEVGGRGRWNGGKVFVPAMGKEGAAPDPPGENLRAKGREGGLPPDV